MTRYIQEYIPITEDMIVKPHEDDLIRRVDAINTLHEYFKEGFDSDKWWNSTHVLCALNDAPTVDAVEVVRCKDCINWNRDTIKHKRVVRVHTNDFTEWDEAECEILANLDGYNKVSHYTCDDDFCSYGEKVTE